MSNAKVRGKVHLIEGTKTYGQKGFRKRLVVLEQDGDRFTNYIPLEFTHEGCDTADELKLGDEVEVDYRLSGRKWQKDPQSEVKFFLNAEATNFTVLGGSASPSHDRENTASNETSANSALSEAAYDDDDVPF